jgi:hypothetical protein
MPDSTGMLTEFAWQRQAVSRVMSSKRPVTLARRACDSAASGYRFR